MSKQQDSTTQHPRELLSHHPDPEQTGRVYLSPRTPSGEGGDPVGQSWCLQVRSGVWVAGLAQPPARVLALGLILLSFCLLLPEFSWAGGISLQ